jgi:isoleucyl-tRNA synthetase
LDYSKTLNLPKTDFPMRGNLPQREPEILKFWEEINIYEMVQQKNRLPLPVHDRGQK